MTTSVKVVKTGNMVLVDTPGTNDPDKKRPDSVIQIDIVNTIRPIITNEN